jgi:hypothetical protein
MFTDKEMKPVIEKLTTDTKELFDIYDERRLFKTTKQKSEDISGLLENAMEDLIKGAVAPKIDCEPDIRMNGEPVEIKTSGSWKCGQWLSGGFSKREGHFLFVLWELDKDNKPSFFMAGKDLIRSDWKKSTSKNYYGTSYGKKNLYEKKDDVIFYHGYLEQYGKMRKCIRIHKGGKDDRQTEV